MRNRNRADYNRQLVQRGSLTFLVDPKMLHTKKCKSRGRPTEFSDALIVMLLTIKIQ
ncbi:MAG: transposase [Verrucomicrobia bacterium]|nr:transposase [Verrucomicrobiota bacterium]MBS0646055.1 transposase [Verrucomicrobiota bacterium]